MKLIGFHFADIAEIQEAVTDEFTKVQKLYDRAKVLMYANGAYFE
jgi:hypothetical protein